MPRRMPRARPRSGRCSDASCAYVSATPPPPPQPFPVNAQPALSLPRPSHARPATTFPSGEGRHRRCGPSLRACGPAPSCTASGPPCRTHVAAQRARIANAHWPDSTPLPPPAAVSHDLSNTGDCGPVAVTCAGGEGRTLQSPQVAAAAGLPLARDSAAGQRALRNGRPAA